MYLLFIRKLSNRVYTKINTFVFILYLIINKGERQNENRLL